MKVISRHAILILMCFSFAGAANAAFPVRKTTDAGQDAVAAAGLPYSVVDDAAQKNTHPSFRSIAKRKFIEHLLKDDDEESGNVKHSTAVLLAALLGWSGAARFYLGYKKTGIIQVVLLVALAVCIAGLAGSSGSPVLIPIILLTVGIGWFWFIDLIRIITRSLKPKSGDYD